MLIALLSSDPPTWSAAVDGLIISDPRVMMGKPVIAGTRITIEHILDELAAGRTVEELLDCYPRLTRDGIAACVQMGARGA